MKKKIIIFLLIVLTNFFKKSYCNNIDKNYIYNSYEDLINKKYKLVLEKLESINENYLSYKDFKNLLIETMYVNYKLNNLESANKIADKFLNLYENNEYTDYVLYVKGLINLKLDDDLLKKTFNLNFNEKNTKYINESLLIFNKLINNYPKSKYYPDSLKKIKYIKERLVIYNLSIIDFYFKKSLYISAINRSINLLNLVVEEPYIYYVISYIKKSCNIISLKEIENNIDLIIEKNKYNFNKMNLFFK